MTAMCLIAAESELDHAMHMDTWVGRRRAKSYGISMIRCRVTAFGLYSVRDFSAVDPRAVSFRLHSV